MPFFPDVATNEIIYSTMKYRLTNLILSSIIALFLAGCITFEPTVDLTQFYILNSKTQAYPARPGKTVFVRDVSLADYLDNSQIAQREGPNKIQYLAQHRWAGSLEEMVAGVISDEINSSHPGYNAAMMERGNEDLILDVKILRFDFDPGASLNLNLEYTVMDGDSRKILRHEQLSQQQALASDASMTEIVSMMESILRQLVGEMKLK